YLLAEHADHPEQHLFLTQSDIQDAAVAAALDQLPKFRLAAIGVAASNILAIFERFSGNDRGQEMVRLGAERRPFTHLLIGVDGSDDVELLAVVAQQIAVGGAA